MDVKSAMISNGCHVTTGSDIDVIERRRGWSACAGIILFVAAFAVALSAPVELKLSGDNLIDICGKTANARGGHGGGGHGGGGHGGGGYGGGGGFGGGNAGGKGKGHTGDIASTSAESGRLLLLTQPEEGVAMAQITTTISRRYPADEIKALGNPHQPISFFTEVHGMSGKEVTHRWFHGDELVFEAAFTIRGDAWRVWSTQLLPKNMPDEWKVEAVDDKGDVLATRELTYQPDGENEVAQQDPVSTKLSNVIDSVWSALKQ
jgi:hypothetical protein